MLDAFEAVRANMYPGAHAAIDDWEQFPWHTHAASPRSSQMLAIDVFGTIKALGAAERSAIGSALARALELPANGPWDFFLEWQDASNLLAEVKPTQVDAVAIGASAIILFECKFTEAGGGCSQINPDKRGLIACNGRYEPQTNPQNQVVARCALSGKGMRYWDHIPAVYDLEANASYAPCPFSFDAYQWMRNVVLARALGVATGKQTRVVATYARAPHLQTSAKVDKGDLGHATRISTDAIRPLAYDRILALAAEASPSPVWADLTVWVETKIERTAVAQNAKPTVAPPET